MFPTDRPENLPLHQVCSRSETGDWKVARTGRLENLPYENRRIRRVRRVWIQSPRATGEARARKAGGRSALERLR